MAISGSLKDVKFIEILKIVGKRTGRLWIYNFDTNIYQEWFVHDQNVRAVRVNRVSQLLPDDVHRAAVALNANTTSQYIFYNQELERLPTELSVPISNVAVRLLSESTDLENYLDQLPNPDTRFARADADEQDLIGELGDFWIRCRAELPAEFSAGEAAARFNLKLEQTQFHFYKLRAARIIKPVRVVSFDKSDSAVRVSGISKQTANAAAVEPDSAAAPLINQPPPLEPSAPLAAEAQRRGLVQRMLDVLSLTKKSY